VGFPDIVVAVELARAGDGVGWRFDLWGEKLSFTSLSRGVNNLNIWW
jgi:hypothetical protein